MRIISRRTLREFWVEHPDARLPLQTWYADVARADWKGPDDIKGVYRNASFFANNRVVFNIKGNRYWLIVAIAYPYRIVYVRFIGMHDEYNNIDSAAI